MHPALLGRIGCRIPLPVSIHRIDRAVRLSRDPTRRQGLRHRRLAERTPLPDPDHPDFLPQYLAAKRGHQPVAEHGRTFARLIAEYRAGPRWKRLAPRTRKDYERVLEWAEAKFGPLPPARMERKHVLRAQSENSERLRFANYIVQVLSVLFEHSR